MNRAAAGEFNRTKWAGDGAQFAAYAQALIELYGPIDAGNSSGWANTRARCIFAVVAHLRRGIISITHNFQARHGLQTMQAVRF
jgi:hypothetical protein